MATTTAVLCLQNVLLETHKSQNNALSKCKASTIKAVEKMLGEMNVRFTGSIVDFPQLSGPCEDCDAVFTGNVLRVLEVLEHDSLLKRRKWVWKANNLVTIFLSEDPSAKYLDVDIRIEPGENNTNLVIATSEHMSKAVNGAARKYANDFYQNGYLRYAPIVPENEGMFREFYRWMGASMFTPDPIESRAITSDERPVKMLNERSVALFLWLKAVLRCHNVPTILVLFTSFMSAETPSVSETFYQAMARTFALWFDLLQRFVDIPDIPPQEDVMKRKSAQGKIKIMAVIISKHMGAEKAAEFAKDPLTVFLRLFLSGHQQSRLCSSAQNVVLEIKDMTTLLPIVDKHGIESQIIIPSGFGSLHIVTLSLLQKFIPRQAKSEEFAKIPYKGSKLAAVLCKALQWTYETTVSTYSKQNVKVFAELSYMLWTFNPGDTSTWTALLQYNDEDPDGETHKGGVKWDKITDTLKRISMRSKEIVCILNGVNHYVEGVDYEWVLDYVLVEGKLATWIGSMNHADPLYPAKMAEMDSWMLNRTTFNKEME
jgi:hypothetical protein